MELDRGHNSMSYHGGAIHVRAGHVMSWQGISSHGKAYYLMGVGMSYQGGACLLFAQMRTISRQHMFLINIKMCTPSGHVMSSHLISARTSQIVACQTVALWV